MDDPEARGMDRSVGPVPSFEPLSKLLKGGLYRGLYKGLL